MRIEDIDPPREQPGAADAIVRSLEAHGLTWDGEVDYQSRRLAHFESVAMQLRADGHAFFCQCARQALRADNAAAGRSPGFYPGTCRERGLDDGALRLRVGSEPVRVDDRLQEALTVRLDAVCGDFIIRRRDGLPAYQLAVVLDDAAAGITDIVRGTDLYDSTPRQIALQRVLGIPTPRYAHVPVLVDAAGEKLSKQTGATGVPNTDPGPRLYRLLAALGQAPPGELDGAPPATLLEWAVAHWHSDPLRGRQHVDAASVAPQQNPVRY